MKKIIKIILPIIILLTIYIVAISYINKTNQKYLNTITDNILKNYKIDEKITYSNLYDNYYIFTTKTKIIVLNKEYEEILVNDIKILSKNVNNYPIIYKNNKLMYEETILKKDKIIIKYHDISTEEEIKETDMEKK